MKKSFIIEIETSNMAIVYNNDDLNKQTPEHELKDFFEEKINTGIKLWLKEQLSYEILNDAFLDNYIPDFDFDPVDNWDDLSLYGNIKITLIDEDERETISFFQREKIPLDEEDFEEIQEDEEDNETTESVEDEEDSDN